MSWLQGESEIQASDAPPEGLDESRATEDRPSTPPPSSDPIMASREDIPALKPSGDAIPIAAKPKTPGSRRDVAEKLSAYDRQIQELKESQQRALAERDAKLAEVMGGFQAIQQTLQTTLQQRQAPQQEAQRGPDPSQLLREADEALRAGEVETFRQKQGEALYLQAMARVQADIPKMIPQQQQAPQLPPEVLVMMAQHQNVAMNGEQGLGWVDLKDRELAMMGIPKGPQRLKKAFEMADQILGNKNQAASVQPQFSQSSAAALQGVPTSRPASAPSSREPGVRLSDYEKWVAKQCGMSEVEYARNLAMTHPGRVER